MCVCVCLSCMCDGMCMCLSVCVCICVCLCICVSVWINVCFCVTVCVCHCMSVFSVLCVLYVYDCTCIMCVPNVCDYCRSMLWFGNENHIHTSFNSNTLIHMAWLWELDTALAPTHNTLYYILYSMTMKIEFYFIYIAYIIIIIILSCHFRSKCI